jgi:CDP-diacylglycerol--glycerol-3-phosphate 3-phosphatidyltransferase
VAIILALLQVNISAQKEIVLLIGKYTFINTLFGILTSLALYITIIITIISGYDYFVKNKDAIKIDK